MNQWYKFLINDLEFNNSSKNIKRKNLIEISIIETNQAII